MYLEELKGKTIAEINPFHVGNGCYMMEFLFTDGTVFRVEREHSMEHYLEWKIESN